MAITLSRDLVSRAAWITAACMAAALVLALWDAEQDARRERRGAEALAQLVPRLTALQQALPSERPAHLAALRAINASGEMRHLWLHLEDDKGQVLVSAPDPLGSDLAQRWEIRTKDGAAYRAALRWNPASEARESRGDMAGNLAVLALFGALMLAGIHWAVRRAFAPLHRILDAIARYERRDYRVRLPPMRTGELDQIGGALNHLAGALEASQAERRALSRKLMTAQEAERARLARDLHDEFGQVLTAMRVDIAWLVRKSAHEPVLQVVARDLDGHCAKIQGEVRTLLQRLRPHGAHPDGRLVPTERLLEELVQGWRDQPGQAVRLACDVSLAGSVPGPELTLTLYRMTQEALTNVMRHAQATMATVRVTVGAGPDGTRMLHWSVEDDGNGIEDASAAMARSHGLRGLRERAWAHLGTLTIAPMTGQGEGGRPGCRLRASFPLAEVEAEGAPIAPQPLQPSQQPRQAGRTGGMAVPYPDLSMRGSLAR